MGKARLSSLLPDCLGVPGGSLWPAGMAHGPVLELGCGTGGEAVSHGPASKDHAPVPGWWGGSGEPRGCSHHACGVGGLVLCAIYYGSQLHHAGSYCLRTIVPKYLSL